MDALGIKLVDGKFVAQLEDYYKERLIGMRSQPVNLDMDMRKAS